MGSESAAKLSTNRDRQSDPKIPQGMPFPKNVASIHVVDIPVCGKTDTSSENTPEPYDGATHLTSCVDPMTSALEDRLYTIHDSPKGSVVIMVGSSHVEDRDPLPSSKKDNPPEDDMSPAPHQTTFPCTMLDSRTQRPCGKAFSRRTDLIRHQKQFLHVPEKRDFQCGLCLKKYVYESGLHNHMRKEHGSDCDPNAKQNGKDLVIPDGGDTDKLNDSTPQTNIHDQVLDRNEAVHPDGGIPHPSKQKMTRKRNLHEIIDLTEMPDEEIERHRPKPRRDDKSASGTSTRRYVKGIDHQNGGSARSVNGSGSRASGTGNTNPKVQTGRVKGKKSRSRIHQPKDSGRFEVTCKLVNPKTGKVCNKVISRTKVKWVKSALKTHQDSAVHCLEKKKAYRCDQCDKRYSFPEDLRRHKMKAHGEGVRVAEFSDEESENSVDD